MTDYFSYIYKYCGFFAWPPWRPCNSTVRTDLDIYTGFIPNQLMTNTSGRCYSL